MNKIHRVLWNESLNSFVAVIEIAKSGGSRAGGSVSSAASAVALALAGLAAGTGGRPPVASLWADARAAAVGLFSVTHPSWALKLARAAAVATRAALMTTSVSRQAAALEPRSSYTSLKPPQPRRAPSSSVTSSPTTSSSSPAHIAASLPPPPSPLAQHTMARSDSSGAPSPSSACGRLQRRESAAKPAGGARSASRRASGALRKSQSPSSASGAD